MSSLGFHERRALRIAPALAAIGAILAGATLRADTIVLANGDRIPAVKVASATWESVEYEVAGESAGAKRLPGDRVESVVRDSVLLEDARRSMRGGGAEQALRALDAADLSQAWDWEKAEAAYLRAEALRLSGRPAEAIEAYDAYLDLHREEKDWWVPHAVYGKGFAALEAGEPEKAREQFDAMGTFGPTWKLRGGIGEGRALMAKGEHVDARIALNGVINDRRAPTPLKQEAMVRRAEVLLRQKQYDPARKELEDGFFKTVSATPVAYTRYRGLAALLMAKAYEEEGGEENLEKAETWFLTVAVLYREFGEEYREAARGLADVYERLDRPEPAAEWRRRGAASVGASSESTGEERGAEAEGGESS